VPLHLAQRPQHPVVEAVLSRRRIAPAIRFNFIDQRSALGREPLAVIRRCGENSRPRRTKPPFFRGILAPASLASLIRIITLSIDLALSCNQALWLVGRVLHQYPPETGPDHVTH
jgi:hypothetical protein